MNGDISPACGPIVLGTELSTPLEMASVYSTFANRGMQREPSIITRVEQVDQDGNVNVIWERTPQEQRVLTEQQADTVTDVLQGVISNGTGTGADIGRPAAGKTGTAQANRDAWFVGYTPRLTAAVWMGRTNNDWDDPETPEREQLRPPMAGEFAVNGRDVTGGSFPAQIWAQFMRTVSDERGWNDQFPEVPEEALTGGEIVGTPPPTQPTTTVPPGGVPPTTPPQNSTTTTSPDSTTSSSSSIPTTDTSDTTGPTFTIVPPTSDTTEPGPGRPND
jgi:penicillin-binding protein 1A